MQEEIEQKSFNIMISTTKLSARTVLRAIKAALRLYQSKASQGKQSVRTLLRQNRIAAFTARRTVRADSLVVEIIILNDFCSISSCTAITSYNKIVVFIDRSPAECYNKFRMLWIGGTSPTAKTVFGRLQPQLLC